jgi:hemolysin activation/secretion protein
VNLNNPFGHGDVVTLRALTSWDGLNYGRASYQTQLGRADAGIAYTALSYDLGKEFDPLDAHGNARIASVYGRYPLLRSRASSLYAQLGVDAKKFRDEVGAAASTADKHATAGMLSLVGDSRDRFAGGGVSAYSLTWTTGNLELKSAAALAADASTARTDGHYNKVAASFMRVQRLTDTVSLYGAVQGQLASQNLDVSEKMELGGAAGVRAYPEGEAYIDQGYVVNVEARALLPKPFDLMPGQLQLAGFVDGGTGRVSKTPWSTGDNTRTLTGGGLGLSWFDTNRFSVKAYYAHTIGASPVTAGPDSDSRVWISAVKFF